MKRNLLFLVTMFFTIAANAQTAPPASINNPRTEHDSVSCSTSLIQIGCNLVPNPDFSFTGDSLEAFSNGNVSMWQDVNNLTSDINGALGSSMGCSLPTVPGILSGANFASMLVDNLNIQTEGIAGRILPLAEGRKYALSFFLATSKLTTYRPNSGSFTLKIYLANCQHFGVDTSGNPVISGDKQLVYCREFDMKDSDWQQYLVNFTADSGYNMIIICPEIQNSSNNGGVYVHFLYPELIPVNPLATFIPATPTGGIVKLTACGVVNSQASWEGPNGIITNNLNYTMDYSETALPDDEYTFTMWVNGAIGNSIDNCTDDEAAVIEQIATKMVVPESVNCNVPISTGNCNMIPNPVFSYTVPEPPPYPFYNGAAAFSYDFVDNWTSISYGTPDIGGAFVPVPTLPAAISALGGTVNSAGFALQNSTTHTNFSTWYEGIAAKTESIHAGTKYIFSFFVSSTECCAQYNLKVILTNCQTFPTIFPEPTQFADPMPPLALDGNSQTIFCQHYPAASDLTWTQYVVSFTADHDFDMLVIYPELLSPVPPPAFRYLQVLYPELHDADHFISISKNSSCESVLKACGVINATYEWFDGNNVPIGTTSEITVDPSLNPGNYTVNVCVPHILDNPLLSNNCSDNIECLSGMAIVTTDWAGGTSADWNIASNWNPPVVPNSNTTDVYIPSGTPYSPEIIYQTPANEVQVNNLTIATGAMLTNNGWLKVAGNISADAASIDNYYTNPSTNERTITGSLEMNGTCASQTLAGNVFVGNDVKDFKVSNNVAISDFSTTTGEGLDVYGELSFGSVTSTTLTTGDNLTLVSTASSTANVAQIASTNEISGDVTVERYIHSGTASASGSIPTQHAKTWQLLATPTGSSTTGQSIYQSWQESGVVPTSVNGYGTWLVGQTGVGTNFDAYASTASIKYWDPAVGTFGDWVFVTNTNQRLFDKRGYILFVRGDRFARTFASAPNPTILRSKGPLFQPSNPPLTSTVVSGFNIYTSVGNPYASAIDMNYMYTQTGYLTNISNTFAVWDVSIPGTLGLGGYQYIDAGSSYTPTPGGTGNYYESGNSYPEIQSGQAFMVTSTGSTGLVAFDESVKVSDNRLVTRPATPNKQAVFAADLYSGTGICDGNKVVFGNEYSNDIDGNDAGKLQNPGENFMITKKSGAVLAIEKRQPVSFSDTIFYSFNNLRQIAYKLKFTPANLWEDSLHAILVDQYLDKAISLSLTNCGFVDFTVDENEASYTKRFMVVFTRDGETAPIAAKQQTDQSTERPFFVYPNPTENKTISVLFTNQPLGMYKFQLVNNAGQVVFNSNIKITDKNGKVSVRTGKVATGSYQLVIAAEDGKKLVQQVVVK